MSNRASIERWVEGLNSANIDAMMALYAEDASLHIVFAEAVESRAAIREMFAGYFAAAKMHCIVERLHEADAHVVLEWRDPIGLRGCNIFEFADGKIVRQRNYFDQLTFLRKQGLPIPPE